MNKADKNTKKENEGEETVKEETGGKVYEMSEQVTFDSVMGDEKGVDYEKLIKVFGCTSLHKDLIDRFERLTGQKSHQLLRRGIYFCHREFNKILDCIEQGKPFYLYTGRGPSDAGIHLGHAVPFVFNKYLQDVFGCILVIQITDDEKFIYKENLKLEKTIEMGHENIKDIIAFGFNPLKTFIFSDCEYIPHIYKNCIKIQKAITFNTVRSLFGFTNSDNIGKIAFPAMQCAPCFPDTFPHIFGNKKDYYCLIPCAIDQDPYFRMTRDICQKMGYKKTCTIYAKFLPALEGKNTKSSSSGNRPLILMNDKPSEVKTKINKFAFSGGKGTAEEQKELGANLDVDVSYSYLEFWLADDDKLAEIKEKYSTGKMLTGEIKSILVQVLNDFLKEYQDRRSKVTDDDVKLFTTVRKMDPSVDLYKRMEKKPEEVVPPTNPSKYLISKTSDLSTLEKLLTNQMYIHGNQPGCEDAYVYYQWFSTKSEPNQSDFPAVWAWFALISLYNHNVLELWKNIKEEKKEVSKEHPKDHQKDKKNKKDNVDHTKPAPKQEKADECDDLFADETPEQIKAREDLEAKNKKNKEENKKKDDKKPAIIAKSIVLLDIKVFEIDQDLDKLAARVLSEVKKDGLVWKTEYQKLDVCYGIKKLRMGCVVEDEKVSVDDIIDDIQAWEDDVQSVDIVSFNKL